MALDPKQDFLWFNRNTRWIVIGALGTNTSYDFNTGVFSGSGSQNFELTDSSVIETIAKDIMFEMSAMTYNSLYGFTGHQLLFWRQQTYKNNALFKDVVMTIAKRGSTTDYMSNGLSYSSGTLSMTRYQILGTTSSQINLFCAYDVLHDTMLITYSIYDRYINYNNAHALNGINNTSNISGPPVGTALYPEASIASIMGSLSQYVISYPLQYVSSADIEFTISDGLVYSHLQEDFTYSGNSYDMDNVFWYINGVSNFDGTDLAIDHPEVATYPFTGGSSYTRTLIDTSSLYGLDAVSTAYSAASTLDQISYTTGMADFSMRYLSIQLGTSIYVRPALTAYTPMDVYIYAYQYDPILQENRDVLIETISYAQGETDQRKVELEYVLDTNYTIKFVSSQAVIPKLSEEDSGGTLIEERSNPYSFLSFIGSIYFAPYDATTIYDNIDQAQEAIGGVSGAITLQNDIISSSDVGRGYDLTGANDPIYIYCPTNAQLTGSDGIYDLIVSDNIGDAILDGIGDIIAKIGSLGTVKTDPRDYMFSVFRLPIDIPVADKQTNQPFKCGWYNLHNISGAVDVDKTLKTSIETDFGILTIDRYLNNALDYQSQVSIYLPYIGYRNLNTVDVMGKTLHLVYRTDLITGDCVAVIYVDNSAMYSFKGNMSLNLPISKENNTDVLRKAGNVAMMVGSAVATGGASMAAAGATMTGQAITMAESIGANPSALGTATGGALAESGATDIFKTGVNRQIEGQNIESVGKKINTAGQVSTIGSQLISPIGSDRGGGIGSNDGWLAIQTPHVIIKRPKVVIPSYFGHYFGYPCNKFLSLSNLTGFTQMEQVHLEGIPCTGTELDMIDKYLKGGVIL